MKQVEVFKTSVRERTEASRIIALLLTRFPDCKVNFDLEDCDRILRIEVSTGKIAGIEIEALVATCGHRCEAL